MKPINWQSAINASEAERKIQPLTELPFSNNWNMKLNCDCFSTIRIANDRKYIVGKHYLVTMTRPEKIPVCEAKLITITPFRLDKLTEGIARLDTGYSAAECRNIMRSMYGEKADGHLYAFMIFQSTVRYHYFQPDLTILADRKLSGI